MSLIYFSKQEIEYIKTQFYKELSSYECTKYKLSELDEVIVINDSLVLFVGINERKATKIGNEGEKYYSLHIEELLYNELGFRHNNIKFCKMLASHFKVSFINSILENAEGSSIIYRHFRGFNPVYWSSEPSFPQSIAQKLPELKLQERYEAWEGIHYYFIVIELINDSKVIQRGVAYTTNKPHSYMLNLGTNYIKTGYFSPEIRVESQEFFKYITNLKGIPRKDRLEKYMQYFFFEKSFREKDDVWKYADKLLNQANQDIFKDIPRSTYIKPVYKWTSEELCLKLTKKIYKKYTIIYQYRPFFLRSSFGGQMSYDIYIQELKVAIEYQGKQHFEPVAFFGGKESFEKTQQRDKEKRELSKKHGIKLVYINFDDPITAELIKARVEN